MSVSSLLEKIQKRGKVPSQSSVLSLDNKTSTSSLEKARNSTPSPRPLRPVDPVVARLKEARRQELERKEAARKQASAAAGTKKTKGSSSQLTQRSTQKTAQKPSQNARKPGQAVASSYSGRSLELLAALAARKKVNYKDLMKKASSIDNSKLSLKIKAKSALPPARPPPSLRSKTPESSTTKATIGTKLLSRTSNTPRNDRSSQSKAHKAPTVASTKPRTAAPLPVRQPSQKLSQSLNTRRTNREDEDDDDDMLSFLASDDEEVAQDYDRDEIWAMFNKGKKRSYYDRYDDYDSDDMEATGAEILAEEMRSKRTAEIEDRREREEEQRLQELKRQRKHKNI